MRKETKNLTLRTLKGRYKKLDKEYRLYIDLDNLVARLYKPTPKGKYAKEKQLWGYKFQNENQLINYVNQDYRDRVGAIRANADRKKAIKIRDEKARKNVKVGDTFNCSWGFEQTQQDFYVVIDKPSDATVIVQQVGYTSLDETSWCSENVKIDVDYKIGKPFKVRLNGDSFKLSSYQYASKFENIEQTFHRSWGY